MENKSRGVGVSFLGLLGLLFIALKLMGHIDWSWWLVLLPIYAPAVTFFGIAFVIFLCLLTIAVLEKLGN